MKFRFKFGLLLTGRSRIGQTIDFNDYRRRKDAERIQLERDGAYQDVDLEIIDETFDCLVDDRDGRFAACQNNLPQFRLEFEEHPLLVRQFLKFDGKINSLIIQFHFCCLDRD